MNRKDTYSQWMQLSAPLSSKKSPTLYVALDVFDDVSGFLMIALIAF